MGDFDLKYKWRPDMYHSIIFIAEALIGSRLTAGGNEALEEPARITATRPVSAFLPASLSLKKPTASAFS